MTTTGVTPQRLYLMQVGSVTVSAGDSRYGLVACYLIQMTDGTNVLIAP
jgi:hypothetical protein